MPTANQKHPLSMNSKGRLWYAMEHLCEALTRNTWLTHSWKRLLSQNLVPWILAQYIVSNRSWSVAAPDDKNMSSWIKTGCSIQGHMTLCLPQISKFKGSQKLALPPRLIDEIWTCKIVIGPRNCNSQIVKCQINFPPKIGSSNLVPSDHKKVAENQEWVLCWS